MLENRLWRIQNNDKTLHILEQVVFVTNEGIDEVVTKAMNGINYPLN